jgi:uncharacterized protein (DUF433 family)/DNA-binding transcriptional MerR regulator
MKLVDAALQGTGIYSIPEAARYARINAKTLRSWFGTAGSNRAKLYREEIESTGMKVLSFFELIEALAVRSLRTDHGVSLQRIRQALETANERYGIHHLFARKEHKTVLIGSDIYIFFGDDTQSPVQLTGKHRGQKSFKECIEMYMQDLDFDAVGLAKVYTAFRFKGEEVILNPKLHFGDPVMKRSGYTANTLYSAAVAEGSLVKAAHLYDVSETEVEAAYRYCSTELSLAA